MAETVKIEIPIETVDNTDPELSNITNNLNQLGDAAQKAQQKATNANQAVSKFDRTSEKAQKSLSSWVKEKYQVLLEAKDNVSPILSTVKNGLKTVGGKIWNITMKAVDLVTSPVKGIINLLKNPIFQVGAILGVSIGLKDTIDTFSTFEATMSKVEAISGATAEQMDALTEKAKQMGADTKFSATESGEAFTYMAMAGWNAQQMLDGIGGIMSLSAADGLDLATTSDIVTDAITAFGMQASESAHFADVLATASSSANTNVSMLGESFKYVAPVAGAMKYSVEDISIALGLMANSSVKGSMAGTALKTAIANMASPTDKMSEAMKKYGVSLTDSNGEMKSFRGMIDNLRDSLGSLSETEQTAAASTIFGKEAMAGMLAIINASETDYQNLTEAIDNADGAADKMAATMMDNLAGAFESLEGAVETVKLTLGERLKPYLVELAQWLENKMPAIEELIVRVMDKIDKKVEQVRATIKEFTGTDEWENADIFGKIKIAWDEIIGKPFSDWWDSTGHNLIVGKAGSIGHGIGSAVSTGLLALLGVDVSGAMGEGATVGSAFAKGLIDGFNIDTLKDKIWDGIKGIFSNAAKILPGGEEADLSSWLSAAMIAKVGTPLISTLFSSAKLGKTVLGSGEGELGLGGSIIGSAAAGTGLKGLGASAGMFGLKLGSTATTGAGLIATGAAAATGGIVGGATLISGGIDAYKSIKSDDSAEKEAYSTSAKMKVGGVAAGAAIGSMILPGVGTLIGAGIGGLAGWFGGSKVKENYEETKQAAEDAAEAAELMGKKSKYALEGATFENSKLKDAFNDTNVSVEDFANMMQEATTNKIKSSFGDIKLTFQEIEEAAKQIALEGKDQSLTTFTDAAQQAETSMSNLQSAITSMDKLNWKASLGVEFSDTEIAAYKTGVDNLISEAQQYLEDKHYEAKVAIDLLVDPDSGVDMTTGLNTMYANLQEQINSLGTDLTAKVEVALEDGVITLDEQAEITNLQNQITEITNQISQAEVEANFQSLKVKYSGASLDGDSFADLVTELQDVVQETTQTYDEALNVSLTNLNLQLQTGAITQDQFDEQFQAISEGYQANIQDLAVRVESFELESIADAFGSELDGILPNLEGSVADRLGQALHNAMANGVNVTSWGTETGLASAVDWLGLDGVSAETQTAIASMMGQVAASLPEQLTSALEGSADFSAIGEAINQQIGEGMYAANALEGNTGFLDGIQNSITTSIESIDLTGVAEGVNSKLAEAMSSVDTSGADIDFIGPFTNAIYEQMASAEFELPTEPIMASINTGLTDGLSALDLSGVGSQVGSSVGNAIQNTDMGPINSAISTVKSNTGTAIDSAFAPGFNTSTPVTITANYKLANPSATISFSGGGSGTATVSASIASNAEGDIINGPLLSWVGEDGPEAIIPLGSKRRNRGLSLWEKAGEMLGVKKYANGGVVGSLPSGSYTAKNSEYLNYITESIMMAPSGYNEVSEGDMIDNIPSKNFPSISESENTDGGDAKIQIDVHVAPTFEIDGSSGNEEDIIRIIKAHMKEIADEIGGELAEKMDKAYSNMPLKEA